MLVPYQREQANKATPAHRGAHHASRPFSRSAAGSAVTPFIAHLKLAQVRSASHAELKSSAVLANDLSRIIASGGGILPLPPLLSPPTVLSSEEDLLSHPSEVDT